MPIRVMLVDDDPQVLRAVARELKSPPPPVQCFDVVAAFESAREAIAWLEHHPAPDVAILDLEMKGMSGVEAIQEIRRRWPSMRTVVFTGNSGEGERLRAVRAMADAFLVKPDTGPLVGALLRILEGGRFADQSFKDLLRPLVGMAKEFEAEDLTPHQEQVVVLAAARSDKEIAMELNRSTRTVETLLARAYRRLGVSGKNARHEAAAMVAARRRRGGGG